MILYLVQVCTYTAAHPLQKLLLQLNLHGSKYASSSRNRALNSYYRPAPCHHANEQAEGPGYCARSEKRRRI